MGGIESAYDSAQEYNERKGRHGAFWEDRYHATSVEADEHLHRCLVYIDLNRVRAGVVSHPSKWVHSGFVEIQKPPKRYGIIDLRELSALCGFAEVTQFQQAHQQWVEDALSDEVVVRDHRWSEAIAVGSLGFLESVKAELGSEACIVESNSSAERTRCGSMLAHSSGTMLMDGRAYAEYSQLMTEGSRCNCSEHLSRFRHKMTRTAEARPLRRAFQTRDDFWLPLFKDLFQSINNSWRQLEKLTYGPLHLFS